MKLWDSIQHCISMSKKGVERALEELEWGEITFPWAGLGRRPGKGWNLFSGVRNWQDWRGGGLAVRGCVAECTRPRKVITAPGQQGNPQMANLQLEILDSVASLRKELIYQLQSLSLYRNPKTRSHKLNTTLRDSKHLRSWLFSPWARFLLVFL